MQLMQVMEFMTAAGFIVCLVSLKMLKNSLAGSL